MNYEIYPQLHFMVPSIITLGNIIGTEKLSSVAGHGLTAIFDLVFSLSVFLGFVSLPPYDCRQCKMQLLVFEFLTSFFIVMLREDWHKDQTIVDRESVFTCKELCNLLF